MIAPGYYHFACFQALLHDMCVVLFAYRPLDAAQVSRAACSVSEQIYDVEAAKAPGSRQLYTAAYRRIVSQMVGCAWVEHDHRRGLQLI